MKIKQINCSHKNTKWIREKLTFNFLNGDRVYLVCKDCYKILAFSITKNNKKGCAIEGTQEEEELIRYTCACCRIIKFGDIKKLKRVADWKEE